MERYLSIVWCLMNGVALLIFAGCGSEPPPRKVVQHLGDSMIEWKSAYLPPPVSVTLDDLWEASSDGEESQGNRFCARLADPIRCVGGVPEATARFKGEVVPLDQFRNFASLRRDIFYVQPGRRTFKWMGGDVRRKGGAACSVELRRGPAEFTIYARGQPAAGVAPIMVVLLNGDPIGKFDVTAEKELEPCVATAEAEEGINVLEVQFVNDFFRPPEDRNLFVSEAEIVQTAEVFTHREEGKQSPRRVEVTYRPLPLRTDDCRDYEPAPGLADGPGPWRYCEIGKETVPAMPFPPPSEARFSVSLSKGSSLEVAFGAIATGPEGAKTPVVFEIFIKQGENRSKIDSFVLLPWTPQKERSWMRRVCSLAGFNPGQAELILTSRMNQWENGEDPTDAEQPVVLLSEPVVCASAPESVTLPNVVLVSLDTLRADHLGCYGYDRPTSPVLDAFAEKNILFETVVAQSSWTLPSHASMLSSLYCSAHGITGFGDSIRNLEMLASILKREGYRTKGVADGTLMAPSFGFSLGFESYEEHAHHGFKDILPSVERWLRDYAREPFFLFVHTYDVHSPYHPPKRFRDRFPPPPGTSPELVNGRATTELPKRETPEQRAADLQHVINMYDAGIMYVDEQMGYLFELLKELGKWENTLVIVTSDHGEEFMEHGVMEHGETLYEQALWVPLLMHVPGIQEAARISEIVQLVDIPPTVLAFAGIEPGSEFQGESLVQYLQGRTPLPRVAYAETSELISRRYQAEKFIYDFMGKTSELYDLAADAGEKRNLAGAKKDTMKVLIENVTEFREENRALLGRKTSEEARISDELAEELRQLGYME